MSAWICRYSDGKAAAKIVPPRLRTPSWTGLGAESEEKREPASDVEAAVVDSLKVTQNGRLEKRTCRGHLGMSAFGGQADMAGL
jgi:hypothetical protein